MKRITVLLFIVVLVLSGCSLHKTQSPSEKEHLLVKIEGKTLEERFLPPDGYERVNIGEHSFAQYLRNLLLKPYGSKVKYYNGQTKNSNVYEAVIDLELGSKNLQQCADAVIRLRAEYLYSEKKYNQIHFNFSNGFNAEYTKWKDGYRISVKNDSVNWVKTARSSSDYKEFREYLDTVFIYAGTLSLSKELISVPIKDIQIGDIFIQGGNPGHCVIVVDMAQDQKTGEKIFMLAQSYMPAQDIQILKNPNSKISPWYAINTNEIKTPEWIFSTKDLKRFSE